LDSPEALSSGRDSSWTINIVEENDAFVPPSDQHYTQGIMLTATAGEFCEKKDCKNSFSEIADFLFPTLTGDRAYRLGVFVGQSIFTPKNLGLTIPEANDRPYAGWLYGGGNLYRIGDNTLDKAQLTLGLVGPGAKGGEAQNTWHEITFSTLGAKHVNGWDAQLRNEPGVVLSLERIWRFPETFGAFDVDIQPQVNASLGNIFTYAGAGAMARFGQRINVDWGPPRIEPALSGSHFINHENLKERWVAWYLFAGSEVRLLGRNIFLDGNTFASSASVDKEYLVADVVGGVSIVVPFGRLTASYTLRTKEFSAQETNDEFASITLSFNF